MSANGVFRWLSTGLSVEWVLVYGAVVAVVVGLAWPAAVVGLRAW